MPGQEVQGRYGGDGGEKKIKKPEIVNGWTISQRLNRWQAVSNGIVGYTHHLKPNVIAFARITRPK